MKHQENKSAEPTLGALGSSPFEDWSRGPSSAGLDAAEKESLPIINEEERSRGCRWRKHLYGEGKGLPSPAVSQKFPCPFMLASNHS